MNLFPSSAPLWLLRAGWLSLALVAAPALADAFTDRSRAVQVVTAAGLWSAWAVGLVATAVPRTETLTALRLLAPGVVAVAGWAAIGADRPGWGVAGITVALVTAALALVGPGVSDAFVDGSSYGDERRVALRIPAALWAGPLPLAWAAGAAGATVGPLLLASEQWIAGAAATAVGLALVWLVVRQFHQLSRRWLVFVPAGVVVHDPLRLTDPVLFLRRLLGRVSAADPADDDAVDLTGGAMGVVVELRSREPVTIGLREGTGRAERDGVHAVWVSPVRPGATLELARQKRL